MNNWNSGIFNPNLSETHGKEAFMAEYRRWNNLTIEEQQAEYDAWHTKVSNNLKKYDEEKKQKEYEKSLKGAEFSYVYSDTVNCLETEEATIIWIIVMLVGAIFNERWFIWILATVMWICHIFRYEIRKTKWDTEGKAQWKEKMKNGGK